MKIAVTADLHFHQQLNFCEPGKPLQRLQDRSAALSEVVRSAVMDHGVDAVYVAGDVAEVRDAISVIAANEMIDAFKHAADHAGGVPIEAIPGNHDCPGLHPGVNIARIVNVVPGVTLHSGSALTLGGRVALVPWWDDAERILESAAQLRERGATVLVAHAAVDVEGGKLEIDKLKRLGFDYVFLGDLHKAKKFDDGIRSVGPPLNHHFGEANQRPSYVLYDFDTKKAKNVPIVCLAPRFWRITENAGMPPTVKEQIAALRHGDFVRNDTGREAVDRMIVEKGCRLDASQVVNDAISVDVRMPDIQGATPGEAIDAYCLSRAPKPSEYAKEMKKSLPKR